MIKNPQLRLLNDSQKQYNHKDDVLTPIRCGVTSETG